MRRNRNSEFAAWARQKWPLFEPPEMQSFAALAQGSRGELEWHDIMGPDEIKVDVKVFKPDADTYVTARLEAFDGVNGNKISDLFNSFMPPLKRSSNKNEVLNEVYTTSLTISSKGCNAAKLSYFVYKDRTPHAQPFARGELWIED